MDWKKKAKGVDGFAPVEDQGVEDPGVQLWPTFMTIAKSMDTKQLLWKHPSTMLTEFL